MVNVIGIDRQQPDPRPAPSETIAVKEVAKRLGISVHAAYQGIRLDHEQPLPRPRIPGGRLIGDRFFVIRAEFERSVRDGLLPEPPAVTQGPDLVAVLEAVITTLKSA